MTKPLFINTRPAARQSDLPQVAKLADVVHLPLLHLIPQVLDDSQRGFLCHLAKGEYDVLVVVSITAVEYAQQALDKTKLNKIKQLNHSGKLAIVAVGTQTQIALKQLGLIASTPPIASNESMSQMPIFAQAKKVLFWRGCGGRVVLSDFLKAQGKAVDFVNLYTRQSTPNLTTTLKKLKDTYQNRPIFVLISSQMAYQVWQTACYGIDIDCVFIAMGERLGAITGGVVVDNLQDETLAVAIGQHILS